MSLRSLFGMLMALAMFLAPLATHDGGAMAMAPADHHAQMTDEGHCAKVPAKDDQHKAADKSCCVAACVAVAVAPSATMEPLSLSGSAERSAPAQSFHSFLAELPTPPPRRS